MLIQLLLLKQMYLQVGAAYNLIPAVVVHLTIVILQMQVQLFICTTVRQQFVIVQFKITVPAFTAITIRVQIFTAIQ